MMKNILFWFITFSFSAVVLLCCIRLLVFAYKFRKFHHQFEPLPGFKILQSWTWVYRVYTSKNASLTIMIFQLINGFCKLFENEDHSVFWIAFKPFIMVHRAEAVKNLINHDALQDKSPEYRLGECYFGKGLATNNGDSHRNRRRLLNPAFSVTAVKDFIPIFNKQSAILVKKLQQSVDKASLDIGEFIDLWAVDTICESAVGFQLASQEGNEEGMKFKHAVHECAQLVISRALFLWSPFEQLFWISSNGRKLRKALNIIKGLAKEVIEKKKTFKSLSNVSAGNGNDETAKKELFIDKLLDHHIKDKNFTSQDVMDEVMTFLIAGEDTTSLTLKNIIFLLGLHPDAQENVIQEIDSIFGDDRSRPVTPDDLALMKYMECVIKETLRLLPAGPLFARNLNAEIQLDKYSLPKGSTVVFNVYQLHRNPETFPNPEKFDPDRFSADNIANRHPFAYIPFSHGRRNCIGQRFAMVQLKTALSYVFRNFRVTSLDQRDQICYSWEISLQSTKPLRVHLISR